MKIGKDNARRFRATMLRLSMPIVDLLLDFILWVAKENSPSVPAYNEQSQPEGHHG
jgi:hypothetical protein